MFSRTILSRCTNACRRLPVRPYTRILLIHKHGNNGILNNSKYKIGFSPYVRFQSQEVLKDLNEYHKISDKTLHELADYLEELFENIDNDELDLNLGDGVMTIKLGKELGTYVINKQTPNRQIWLSSPTSGPKRYDFIDGQWIYSHDNSNLYKLLEKEFEIALKVPVNLFGLDYYPK